MIFALEIYHTYNYSIDKKILHFTIPSYTQEWFVQDDNALGGKHGNEAATL
jgi:hypothetical protein